LKTYNLEELQASQKTSLDYVEDHKRLLKCLKEQHPASSDDESPLWDLPPNNFSFWTTGNIMDEEGNIQEGTGRVVKGGTDD